MFYILFLYILRFKNCVILREVRFGPQIHFWGGAYLTVLCFRLNFPIELVKIRLETLLDWLSMDLIISALLMYGENRGPVAVIGIGNL